MNTVPQDAAPASIADLDRDYLVHAIKGNPDRQKILSRRLGYHGITRGAASATRIDGHLPLGAVGVGPKPYDVLRNGVPEGVPFMAGQTLNNHQTCRAAALANIDIVDSEGLVENSRTVGAYLLERLREAFAGHPDVEDVRGVGLMAGVGWRRGNLSTMNFYEKTERGSRRAFDGGLIAQGTS